MTITIGRFGRDITTPDVSSVQMSGNTVQVSGFFKAASLNAAKVLRQQLAGCVDNRDEPVVPVACTSDTSLNGFYRVTDASVDVETGDMGNFRFPWSATLERAAPGYNPLVERTLMAGLRTNAHSIALTSTIAFFHVPQATTSENVAAYFTSTSRNGADGAGQTIYSDTNPGASTYVNSSTLPPDSVWDAAGEFYANAAKLESKWVDDSTYSAVVGRSVPARVAATVYPAADWRISNGFVRVTPYPSTGTAVDGLDLKVEHYDGSQWDTAKQFKFTLAGTSTSLAWNWRQFTVLRNDAAAVSVRLAVPQSGAIVLLDITLRRGARFIECRFSTDVARTFAVAVSTVEAATALTGGIRATSNDAAGNRYILASAEAVTNDLTNGSITSGSVTAFNFMIGSEVSGSSATGIETAQNTIYQYMCAQSETYRIVGR